MNVEDLLSNEMPQDLVAKVRKDYVYLYFLSMTGYEEVDREPLLTMDSYLLAPPADQKAVIGQVFEQIKARVASAPKKPKEQITL